MQHEQTIEFGQQALMTTLTLIAPILIVAILVGLLVGVIQAMTQVQDQTISYIPKLICLLVALCYSLPWMFERLSSFTGTVFQSIPNIVSGG
ncbi:MAG: flagellar biosynthesis protein FliQ [Pirellulales bacterium]|nr:flagellar biosynthesis protein FliQ [Pirellulales bacterium]